MILIWIAMGVMLISMITVSYIAFQNHSRLISAQTSFDRQLSQLRHELSNVNSAAVGVGKHLISVEKKLAVNMEKQQQFEMTNVDYLPYKQAVTLVENGASASQLVENCGLSEAEANLMTLVKSAEVKSTGV